MSRRRTGSYSWHWQQLYLFTSFSFCSILVVVSSSVIEMGGLNPAFTFVFCENKCLGKHFLSVRVLCQTEKTGESHLLVQSRSDYWVPREGVLAVCKPLYSSRSDFLVRQGVCFSLRSWFLHLYTLNNWECDVGHFVEMCPFST